MVGSVALLATLAAPAASQWASGRTGIAASLFGANIELSTREAGYFDVGASLDPFLHTWTLAVEEQFYLLFPLVLLVGWSAGKRLRVSRAFVAVGVLATCVCSFAVSFLLSGGALVGDADFAGRLAFYAAPARAWEFGAGALVALLAPLALRLSPSARVVLGAGGIAAVALAAGRAEANELLPVIGTCVLIAAGCGATLGVGRALALRPAVWVGDRSVQPLSLALAADRVRGSAVARLTLGCTAGRDRLARPRLGFVSLRREPDAVQPEARRSPRRRAGRGVRRHPGRRLRGVAPGDERSEQDRWHGDLDTRCCTARRRRPRL